MRKELLGIHHLMRLLAIVLLSVVLAACGSDDAEEDPTATSAPADAQPTVAAEEESPVSSPEPQNTTVPTNVDMSTVGSQSTPAVATPASTPIADDALLVSTPESSAATPATEDAVAAATPAEDTVPLDSATPAPTDGEAQTIPADTDVGDGTTGAIVPGENVASPVASPASGAATPVAAASPAAPLVVSGCEVAEVPPFTGDVTSYQLTTDLNFRTGPGAECDLALPDPIGAFQVVDVIGGPVIQEADGSEWVQIQTLDTTGWLALEFLQPVED